MNFNNLILNCDSYKVSHWKQYPPRTQYIYSYIESRGGKYDSTLFFGLQAFIKEYLMKPITMEDILEAEEFWKAHGEPFNKSGWISILEKYDGYLPIEIKAVPEGFIIPVKNVLLTVVNTDPEFYWVTSFIETALLRAIWYPTTVATVSWNAKQSIKKYMELTGCDLSGLDFKLLDFGKRGVSSYESSVLGGMAHLVNFKGTDTVSGVIGARKYYNEPMAGFSVPASEHSSITSWNKVRELDAYENMLDAFSEDHKIISIVIDSYDYENAVQMFGTKLKDKVIKFGESGGTLVLRPDSGDAVEVVTNIVSMLNTIFGSTINNAGYKTLNYVRVLQGDGIDSNTILDILEELMKMKFSADNVIFGMGGGLLQKVDRDLQKFAMKCSAAFIDGNWIDVYKDPITDSGKRSKRGKLKLLKEVGKPVYKTVREDFEHSQEYIDDVMQVVFRNGLLLAEHTFEEVRKNSNLEYGVYYGNQI